MLEINTTEELVGFFNHFKSTIRANVVTKTVVKLNKRDTASKTIANTLGTIYKTATTEVDLNANYADRVNDERILEGKPQDFTAQQAKWGERINGSIVSQNGAFYLKVITIRKIGRDVYSREDGSEIAPEEFAMFRPPYNGTVKQELDDEVQVRTFKIESIIGLNVDNKMRFIRK